jgi:hypothetical protein
LAALPEKIRGYGFVRERHHADLVAEREELLERFRNGMGESAVKRSSFAESAVPGVARHGESAPAQRASAKQ